MGAHWRGHHVTHVCWSTNLDVVRGSCHEAPELLVMIRESGRMILVELPVESQAAITHLLIAAIMTPAPKSVHLLLKPYPSITHLQVWNSLVQNTVYTAF